MAGSPRLEAFNHPDLESAVRTAVRLAAEVP